VKRVKPKVDIDAVFATEGAVEAALMEAGRQAIIRHKRLGVPIVVWRDGRVVEIPPEDIPEDGRFPPDSSPGVAPAT